MAQLIIVINKIIFYYLKVNKSTYKYDEHIERYGIVIFNKY